MFILNEKMELLKIVERRKKVLTIGEIIALRRKELKLTRGDLSKKTDISLVS